MQRGEACNSTHNGVSTTVPAKITLIQPIRGHINKQASDNLLISPDFVVVRAL